MINKETILSLYNDKLTLMQWLKKVEVALQDATASAFVVNKKGNATISFSIVFEDGTSLESGDIVLQQGESVASARISSGHLILTLTNGDELDAGDVGAVSSFSIDANQHLIVTYQNGSTNDLGAIFQGNVNISGTLNATKVTGDEIIETMSGYSFEVGSRANFIYNVIYASAVKTGNKITFVIALELTRQTGEATGLCPLGTFTIPSSIGAKLYPVNVGGSNTLETRSVLASTHIYNGVNVLGYITKLSNTQLTFGVGGLASMSFDTKYYIRYEATMLLSDNLASE